MRSPFPGMDPFIEACGMWEDFHDDLIAELKRHLAIRVPSKYIVRTGERTYIAVIDDDSGKASHLFKPDVGVVTPAHSPQVAVQAGTAVIDAPASDEESFMLRALVSEEFRESFVEIFTEDPTRRLVTSIEVLSPSHKRKGTAGWEQYQRKRQALLLGAANLVELDLLRGGQRMPMADALPPTPYYHLLARTSSAPLCKVTKAHYRTPLPKLATPLSPPDPDIEVELQPMVDAIYARARYDRDIDYHRMLTPPLPAEDQSWLIEQLAKTS